MKSALSILLLAIVLRAHLDVASTLPEAYTTVFDGAEAFNYLTKQCEFGPRPPGSKNLTLCRDYIAGTLMAFGWNVTLQSFAYRGVTCANIIASWPSSEGRTILLGAHYDTRPRADQDPDKNKQTEPVLGANDGASGAAVLIELASALPKNARSTAELVFFDAEDSGRINGWDWTVGSSHYVGQLNAAQRSKMGAMILLDMVGDSNLRLPRELYSTRSLQDEVWSVAYTLRYENVFLQEAGAYVTDDHKPFLDADIPALDLIQYPFPSYWHTAEDTIDKCSKSSLEIVGRVLERFVVQKTILPTPKIAPLQTSNLTSQHVNQPPKEESQPNVNFILLISVVGVLVVASAAVIVGFRGLRKHYVEKNIE